MLGKLFSTAASSLTPRAGSSSPSRPATALDSVHEDIHTRNLLFPDSEALYQHQHDQVFPLVSSTVPPLTSSANAFDLNPDIDLDLRDVRVVIMQEATATQSAALLFDSHPLLEPSSSSDRQPPTNTRSVSGRSVASPRRISLGQISKPVVITQESSAPRNFGAFDRRPSNHGRGASYAETEGQRSAREYREEMTTFANCIFGSSDVMAFKGTGTKVHIIPTESRSPYSFGDGHGSLGRSSMRSSRLAQSYTSENIAPAPTSAGLPGTGSGLRVLEKKKVLITRIFPVPLPSTDAEGDDRVPLFQKDTIDAANCYPFPSMGGGTKLPDRKPRQKRTPMYAIGLIIQLPASTHLPSVPGSRAGFRGPSSYTDQESYPSSFNSSKQSAWTVLGNGVDSLETSFGDFDDRMDAITQHWDIIKRTLSHLQTVVSSSVLDLLKQVDIASPDPQKPSPSMATSRQPAASVSISGKRVEETIKPYKSNAKLVQLMANALFRYQNIKTEVDDARQRIISGIKTLQAVTRQGRWGIWREEARWVGRWAGGKEEGFFFYNLLTGFLGSHTEWLQALGPENYRRHYYQQRKTMKDEDTHIAARTIIISHDKMAARRLLFLLSSFLPPNQQQHSSFARFYRPSTATSFGGYSQSPPSYVPTLGREESLRRKVNRRTGPNRYAHARTLSFPGQTSNQSSLPTVSHLTEERHERRYSDAVSLKTANLPIPGSEGGTKKSSAVTTTTVTPATTIPHFSTRRPVRGTGPLPRPGSSGSLAADDLFKTLKRGDSTDHYSNASTDSQGYSRWGSMISGFWSNKRRESTNSTDVTPPSLEGLEIGPQTVDHKKGKLTEMVEEAQRQVQVTEETQDPSKGITTTVTYAIPEPPTKTPHTIREPRACHPAGAFESPVKTSINEDDGVIDIDVPLPDYITSSFGSAFSSPSSSGYLSNHGFGPGLEGFEHYARTGPDADAPLNVGGWIPRYHPDFILQANPAQDRLEEDVRNSMRVEPTPPISPPRRDEKTRWVDISCALIADATRFTIKRIRYRRHIMLAAPNQHHVEHNLPATRSQSLYGNPYIYQQSGSVHSIIEDAFDEDIVISMDEALISAVEAVIAQPSTLLSPSTPTSNPGSETHPSSPRPGSRHQTRDREGSDSTAIPIPRSNSTDSHSGSSPPSAMEVGHCSHLRVPEAHLEVPRGECKKVILGALEDIARQVAELTQDDTIDPDLARSIQERESPLRQGVREWMRAVEEWA